MTFCSPVFRLEPGYSFGGPLSALFSDEVLRSQLRTPTPVYSQGSDEAWMLEALTESLQGVGITNPNPAVGCILVDRQGKEISRGATQAYRQAHAEKIAFQKMTDLSALEGGTAYVTLEPCTHHGNQPPCIDLFLGSKLKRVVIARSDPDSRVQGRSIQKLRESGIEVTLGPLESEVTAWNFPFFVTQTRTPKRPFIALKWAQTLDGQLADDSSSSQWISSPPSRMYTHWLRQKYDSILVGVQTVLSDHPRLTGRDCVLPHQHQPLPLILDPQGLCFEVSQKKQRDLLSTTFSSDRTPVILTTQEGFSNYASSWMRSQSHILVLNLGKPPRERLIAECMDALMGQSEKYPTPALETLLGRSLQSLFVEGGAKTLTSFIDAGVTDLIHLFIAPVMTGGQKNRIFLNRTLKFAERFKLAASFSLGEDMILEMTSAQASPVVHPIYKQ